MKIELKKISFNERHSEETNAFAADLYIDGKNVGYAKNDGHGGNTDYHWNTPADRAVIERAEAFCKRLPPHTYPATVGNPALTVPMDLEFYIDLLLEKELKNKEIKKLEKKMVNCIMWGVPGGASYASVKFKVPLSQIPLMQLQGLIDKYKRDFKTGEVFLNTNLVGLGVRL